MKALSALLVLLAATLVAACGTSRADEVLHQDDEIAETLEDQEAPLLVKDPRTLVDLEQRGLAFHQLFGATENTGAALATTAFGTIAQTITSDLDINRRLDPKSGVGVSHPHRQFDASWLASSETRFELVGVVNRLDRQHAGGCGELRFVYRLAYTATESASRLPMTVNVVYTQPNDSAACATTAQRWEAARSGTAEALVTGPLAAQLAAGVTKMRSVEVNLQTVRWPSNERPEFGGHAEYMLRVFARTEAGLEVAALENTPRGNLEAPEKERLRAWITEHLDEIDDGTAILPAEFLTTQVVSVGPVGLVRDANRPFSRLFADMPSAFANIDYARTRQIGSPAALMRRLDTMTCNGCHQARSIAGFHLLGEERDPSARLNALAIGRSPHFDGELAWRKARLAAVAAGTSFTTPRPFAERPTAEGKYGAHCGLGDAGFASWTCAKGLSCSNLHNDVVGSCAPVETQVGDACSTGTVTHAPNPRMDRVVDARTLACRGGENARCNAVSLGFPSGMCRVDCSKDEVGAVTGDTVCGEVPSADGLTRCLAEGKLFADCLSSQNTYTSLRTCDATEQCRDDYACMRVRNGPSGIGACMPPYFAFQARVDGHLVDR